MQRIILKREPRLEAKCEAFIFQREAVNAVQDLEYSAIFHEQGLGKSKIAIDLMLYWLENKLIDTVLFVAKKGLLHNWIKEFDTHTFMKPKMLSQNHMANYYTFNSPSRLILTHYEVLRSEYKRLLLFLKTRNVAVILDESAKIKNPNSSLTQIIFKLAPLFKKRVIMTGTPVANRPYDIWAQIWFLDQGKSFGDNFNVFKKDTDLSNKLSNNIELRTTFEQNLEELFSKISDFTVRERKSSCLIKLPEKEIRTIYTDWEHHQHYLYIQFQEEMRAVIIKEGIPTEDNAEELLKRILRLVQIASNPRLIDEGYKYEPGKFETLKDILVSINEKNEKCIIWSSFTDNVDWLSKELQNFGARRLHGKMNMEKRNRTIDTFLTHENVKVLVATPGAAKEGLTLTIANNVIFYDRTFSLDDYLQAQDRIHRISQEKKCIVYNLIMKNSIDEWVDVLLQSKHLAAQLAQRDISLEYYQSLMSYDFGTIIKNILNIE
ncbi:DEAD/DEAH box helicase [bacterium]|nr:DEAD/DEAH box helicase [bacterium]